MIFADLVRRQKISSPLTAIGLALICLFAAACSGRLQPSIKTTSTATAIIEPVITPTTGAAITPTILPEVLDCSPELSLDACRTLGSLSLIDDHPLYTMHYYGSYEDSLQPSSGTQDQLHEIGIAYSWGCSLFAALANDEAMIYGRNFDWRFSPAILLFTDPDDGFDSVAMVDYEYLGFTGIEDLTAVPIEEKLALLRAPLLPFDGMNERGLVVGMAAVPPGQGEPEPEKETIDSLGIIRQMLDHASSVPEAISLFEQYNIDMGDGPPLHYLVADAEGQSALLEFYVGKRVVMSSTKSWQSATNFLESPVQENPTGQCWRHDLMEDRLSEMLGKLSTMDGLALLEEVSQANTQWSIVYDLDRFETAVVMGRDFDNVYNFQLREP